MNQVISNKSVATELLCTPGLRMTNKERKALARQREKDVTPTRFDPLGVEHRLEYRLGQRGWKQLCRWLRRATARRKDAQAKFQMAERKVAKLGAKTGQPIDSDIELMLFLNRAKAQLNSKVALLDIFIDAVSDEIGRRQRLWESVARAGATQFARQLKRQLQAS